MQNFKNDYEIAGVCISTAGMVDCEKGEIIYEKTPEKIQIFHDCFMGTLSFCRPAFRKRSCGSGKAFLHKDKNGLFPEADFP